MRARDLSIDTLRGIACLLLVAFHVVGHNAGAGIQVEEDSGYRFFVQSVMYLRMPLFAFLAGIVYGWRPLGSPGKYGAFMDKKARRLLIPYVVFIPLLGLAQILVPAANNVSQLPFWQWFIFPLSPYWFLIATFWVYAAVSIADSYGLLKRRSVLFACIAVAFTADAIVPSPSLTYDTLGLRSALFLLPFFLVGLAATRFDWRGVALRWKLLVALIAVICTTITQLGIWDVIEQIPSRHHPIGMLAGLSLCLLLLATRMQVRWLAWIGGYSSGIFLFHPFTVAGARSLLRLAGVHNTELLFVGGMISGVLLSITAVFLFRKVAVGRLLLGEKWSLGSTKTSKPSLGLSKD